MTFPLGEGGVPLNKYVKLFEYIKFISIHFYHDSIYIEF